MSSCLSCGGIYDAGLVWAGHNSVRVSCKSSTAGAQSIASLRCARDHYERFTTENHAGVASHTYLGIHISSHPSIRPSFRPFSYPSSVNYHLVLIGLVGLLWWISAGTRERQAVADRSHTIHTLTHTQGQFRVSVNLFCFTRLGYFEFKITLKSDVSCPEEDILMCVLL